MAKKIVKPRVLRVEETHIGKILKSNPTARRRHNRIVRKLREEAREEIEALERSQRITGEDLHTMIY